MNVYVEIFKSRKRVMFNISGAHFRATLLTRIECVSNLTGKCIYFDIEYDMSVDKYQVLSLN